MDHYAKQADITYSKPDKYDRTLLDGKPKINKDGKKIIVNVKGNVKKKAFGDNKIIKDRYSDNALVMRKSDAEMLYGKENMAAHLAETDHVKPLNQIYNETKDNAWISNDDIADIANDDKNLVVTSRKFNNAKRDKTNEEFVNDKEYLDKKGIKLSEDYKQKMLEDGKNADKYTSFAIKKKSVHNFFKTGHKAGIESAKAGAMIGGGMSAIRNAVALARGDKDAEEALADTAKDTAVSAANAYSIGFVGTTLKHIMSQSANEFFKSLSETNLPSQIVVAAIETGKTLNKYINGDIDAEQCVLELGEKGTGMITSSYGAVIGQLMIPVPIVGSMIGGMIGYAFSSSYYNELITAIKNNNLAHEELIYIESECKKALEAIHQYRQEIEYIAEQYFSDYISTFDNALNTMQASLIKGDADEFIFGANMITNKLNGNVQYNNMEEFEYFMNNDEEDFIL